MLELSDDDWHRGMVVYFLNVVRPTRLVTPIMQAQGGDAIVKISTFAAFEPDPVSPPRAFSALAWRRSPSSSPTATRPTTCA